MPDSVLNFRLDVLRSQILELTELFGNIFLKTQSLIPGVTAIPVSGQVTTSSDFESLINSSLGGWLSTQRYMHQSEKELSNFVEDLHALSVNSSPSSNLIALSVSLRIKPGESTSKPVDEVISGSIIK
jgi:hypothetical protein